MQLKPIGAAPFKYGYVLVTRDKQGRPWREKARFDCDGQTCLAEAEEHCEKEMGFPPGHLFANNLLKLVDYPDWIKRQVEQHLRAVRG